MRHKISSRTVRSPVFLPYAAGRSGLQRGSRRKKGPRRALISPGSCLYARQSYTALGIARTPVSLGSGSCTTGLGAAGRWEAFCLALASISFRRFS